MGENCFKSWFSFQRFWGGEILSFNIKHYSISLDFRKDWVSDMKGKI